MNFLMFWNLMDLPRANKGGGCLYTWLGFLVAPLSMSLKRHPLLEGLGIQIYCQVYPQGRFSVGRCLNQQLLQECGVVGHQLGGVDTGHL